MNVIRRTPLLLLLSLLSTLGWAQQTIFLKNTSSTVSPYQIVDEGHGTSGSPVALTATLTSSGTSIQAQTNGWITPPLAGSVTISGTITVNIWAKEAATANNAGIQVKLFKYSGGTESGTAFATCTFGTELTTSMVAKNYSCTPTSTAFAANDRIVVRTFFVNCTTSGCPTGTMGSGTGTIDYNRSTAADGETSVAFTETPLFTQSFAATAAADTTTTPVTAQFGSNPVAIASGADTSSFSVSGFVLSHNILATISLFTQSDLTAQFDLLAPLSMSSTAASATSQAASNAAAASAATAATVSQFVRGQGMPATSSDTVDAGTPLVAAGPAATAVVTVASNAIFGSALGLAPTASITTVMAAAQGTATTATAGATATETVTQFGTSGIAYNFNAGAVVGTQSDITGQFDLLTPLSAAPTVSAVAAMQLVHTINPTAAVSAANNVTTDWTQSQTGEFVGVFATAAFLQTSGFSSFTFNIPVTVASAATTGPQNTSPAMAVADTVAMGTPVQSVGQQPSAGAAISTSVSRQDIAQIVQQNVVATASAVAGGGRSVSPAASVTASMNSTVLDSGKGFAVNPFISFGSVVGQDVVTNATSNATVSSTASISVAPVGILLQPVTLGAVANFGYSPDIGNGVDFFPNPDGTGGFVLRKGNVILEFNARINGPVSPFCTAGSSGSAPCDFKFNSAFSGTVASVVAASAASFGSPQGLNAAWSDTATTTAVAAFSGTYARATDAAPVVQAVASFAVTRFSINSRRRVVAVPL